MSDANIENKIFLLSTAYDSQVFPSRQRVADKNGRKLRPGKLPPFTAHYLHLYLPLNSQNPANTINSRNRRPNR